MRKRIIISVAVVLIVVFSALSVNAASLYKAVTAYTVTKPVLINGFNINDWKYPLLNYKPEGAGSPYIYIPVAILKNLGMTVNYDDKTQIVGIKNPIPELQEENRRLVSENEQLKAQIVKLQEGTTPETPGTGGTEEPAPTPKPANDIVFQPDNFYNIKDSNGSREYNDNGINALKNYVFNREHDSLGIIGDIENLTDGTVTNVAAQKNSTGWEIVISVRNAASGMNSNLESVLQSFDKSMKSLYGNSTEDVVKTQICYTGTFMGKTVEQGFKLTKSEVVSKSGGTISFSDVYGIWSLQDNSSISTLETGKSYYFGIYNNSGGLRESVVFDESGKACFLFIL